jgi:hypothetical protein
MFNFSEANLVPGFRVRDPKEDVPGFRVTPDEAQQIFFRMEA